MYRVYIKKPSLILQDKQHDNDLNYEHTIQNDKLKKILQYFSSSVIFPLSDLFFILFYSNTSIQN